MPILESKSGLFATRKILRRISDALLRRQRILPEKHAPEQEMQGRPATAEPHSYETTRERLSERVVCLQLLDAERERRGDLRFGKTTEDRIIWSELIELELQDIDEQVRRISATVSTESKVR
jgi:hypothetical protein